MTAQEINKGIHIAYNTEKLIETDVETKATVIATQVSKGIMTPNEGAIAMGNDPIDSEWGDYHFTQSQNQAIEKYPEWANNNTNTTVKPKEKEDEDSED